MTVQTAATSGRTSSDKTTIDVIITEASGKDFPDGEYWLTCQCLYHWGFCRPCTSIEEVATEIIDASERRVANPYYRIIASEEGSLKLPKDIDEIYKDKSNTAKKNKLIYMKRPDSDELLKLFGLLTNGDPSKAEIVPAYSKRGFFRNLFKCLTTP